MIVAERLWSDPGGDVEDFYRRMQNLLNVTFTHEQRQRQQLHGFGLSAQQIELAMFLEPVKWYGRLLGQQALEARIAGSEMPQARPYRVDTRLDRLIDVISPESLKARALRRSSLEDWQDFASLLANLDINEWPDDVQKAIGGLQEFGRAILGNGLDVETAEALYGPHGDYMLAPVHAWLSRVD